jgi:hypothetical protein
MSVFLFFPVRENYSLLSVKINRSILLNKPRYIGYKNSLISDDIKQIAYSFISVLTQQFLASSTTHRTPLIWYPVTSSYFQK